MENWIDTLNKVLNNKEIKESQILSVLPFQMLERWDNFMRGKTCPILEDGEYGVYEWDLKQFLNTISL